MKIILTIFLISVTFSTHAAEFMLTGGGTYNQFNILGQDEIPTYRGLGVSGDLDYLVSLSKDVAISFMGVYHTSTQENIARDLDIKETISLKYIGAGMRLWLENSFFSASIGQIEFEDQTSGTVKKNIRSKEHAYELGIGQRIRISEHAGLVLSFHALNSTLHPENGSGFYSEYGIWNYRVGIGLNFIIPSTPKLISKY